MLKLPTASTHPKLAYACTAAMASVIGLNLTKLPYYTPALGPLPMTSLDYDPQKCSGASPPDACYGMLTDINLEKWFGFHGTRMASAPELFLFCHNLMGIVVLLLVCLVLLEFISIEAATPTFLVLSAVFAIHILPVSMIGIPSRLVGFNLNGVVIAITLFGVLFGIYGHCCGSKDWRVASWVVITGCCFGAPALDLKGVVEALLRLWSSGSWPIPLEPSRPLELSGHCFFARLGCNWLAYPLMALMLAAVAVSLLRSSHTRCCEEEEGTSSDDAVGSSGSSDYEPLKVASS
ncbi:unnamed protein product [Polarella glacialis]|uniref:Uncharacterized protein n=1 Tax=Polarella glacialis TaxID=89957 RepID=A0A813DEL7_POLGL|nr:unnamed protein product [Polarella glacialis]